MRRVSNAQDARDRSTLPRPLWKVPGVSSYALEPDPFDGNAHAGPEHVFNRLWCQQEAFGIGWNLCIYWPLSLHSIWQRDLWLFDLVSLLRWL